MTSDATRAVALKCVDYFNKCDFTSLLSLGAPGATYWIAGLQDKIPTAGSKPYSDRILHEFPPFFNSFKSIKYTVVSLTVDGDAAVIEIHVQGEGKDEKDGKVYENDAALRLVVKDGKVAEVREYVDFLAFLKFKGRLDEGEAPV